MLVSIIVPNFNHEAYLHRRMDSIFNQTYRNIEVILLDDASTDNSIEALNEFAKNPQISHFIINDQNSGSPFKQWKKGIEHAKGKYIWIAESDDYCEPTFLEKILIAFEQHPDATICASNLIKVDEKDQLLAKRTNYVDSFYVGSSILKQSFTTGNFLWNASAVVFKKEAVENIDWLKIETMKYCGDWLFWVSILKNGHLITVSDYLSYYRRHNRSVSNSISAKWYFLSEGLDIVYLIVENYAFTQEERISLINVWSKRLFNNNLTQLQKLEIESKYSRIISSLYKNNIISKYADKFKRGLRRYLLLQ